MSAVIRIADAKGRVILPGFANATVIVEACSPNEYRIRKAEVIPVDDAYWTEEHIPVHLSERDGRSVLKSLEKPPRPNAAARRAARRFKENHG